MISLKQFLYDQYLTFRYVLGKTKQYRLGRKKSGLQILGDLIVWQMNECEFNYMYYAMGLHLAGSRQKDFIGRRSFLNIKDSVETKLKQTAGCGHLSYDVVTKDKFYSNSILNMNGINCIQGLAIIAGSKVVFQNGNREDLESLAGMGDTFILKNTVLESGEGVFLCRITNNKIQVNGENLEWKTFRSFLKDKIWVVQKQVYSHEALRRVNSSALNTTRIVTIRRTSGPEFLCGVQGFATGSEWIDSWSRGSVYVGIEVERSCLKEFGITSVTDKKPGILKSHPDSGIVFRDYQIPFLKEAVDLCIRAHNLLYFNFIIGWDVAITGQGPMIVEANEKPGMNAAQCLNGGLRKRIEEYALEILDC